MEAIAREDSVDPRMESSAERTCRDRFEAEERVAAEIWKPVERRNEACVRVL
jgi:hypothetical protein